MKRIKTFFAVALICAMGTVGYNAYADANITDQEKLLLENVEALTQREPVIVNGPGRDRKCGVCGRWHTYCKAKDHTSCHSSSC